MSDASDGPDAFRRAALTTLRVAAAVLAVALSARLTLPVPGTNVPQSAQTLAVVLAGAFLGARGAALALTAYLVVGGLGLPVFADGAAGWEQVAGPTGGYLVGFVVVACGVGLAADRGWLARALPAVAVMLGGHALILLLGWAWLARTLGGDAAWAGGVTPFLAGGIFKSVLAAAVFLVARRIAPPPD